MALPVVESVASNSSISGGTVTVTAPSGIQVGDLLIGSYTSFRPAGTQTAATPAGFTLVQTSDTSSTKGTVRAFYKVAVSADTSASNYVFTSSGADYMQGSMMRVSGAATGSEITVSEKDFIASNGSTTINNTGTTTPPTSESIMVLISGGHDFSIGAIVTTGTYTSTPSVTWTQRMDLGYRDGASDGSSHAVATAPYTGTTEFTSYGYATSEVFRDVVSILLVVSSPENATGTNALLSVSPTHLAQAGIAGTTGTNTLHAGSPTMFAQSGNGQRGTPWTNPNKPATNWNNLAK